MSYTEKVSLSGTALSFLLYECFNSVSSQEGFLIGDITSEITNHISDSQSDNARLDTQIVIRTVLPLPSVSLFYFPTGRIKEDVLSSILSNCASEVVGWYKYRENTIIKPTFRDKLISKGLQKYFEKYHGKKNFVTCNLSSKTSSASSTHTFAYRFGKINCFDMYEYIEDVTANLGEKLTGYKKATRISPNSVFHKVINDTNVQSNNTSNAIISIQEAVDLRLLKEAQIAAKNEMLIKELEGEIKQMRTILSEKQSLDLSNTYDQILKEQMIAREAEMAEACLNALHTPPEVDLLNDPNMLMNSDDLSDSDKSIQLIQNNVEDQCPSPVLPTSSNIPILNYAAALKNKNDVATTSRVNHFSDLITFDDEDKNIKTSIAVNDDGKCHGDSSPEY